MEWVSRRNFMTAAFVLVIITALVTYRLSSAAKHSATMNAAKEVVPYEERVKTDTNNPGRSNLSRDDGFPLSNMEMRRRSQKLKATCKTLQKEKMWSESASVKSLVKGKILVDDFHQLVFCIIPKIGSSNVRRMFLHLGNYVNKTYATDITNDEVNKLNKNITFLSDGSEYAVRRRLRLYKKVIVVRDPFERLISAYRSKFSHAGMNPIMEKEAPLIIKAVRKNGAVPDSGGYNITFAEFIQYLIIQHSQHKSFDEHWRTYTDICKPCLIQYDYVGEYETYDEEMNFLLKEIEAENSTAFPKREYMYKDVKSSALLEQYYRSIPPEHIQKLIKIYSHDQLLFDLQVPDTLTKLLKQI